MQRELKITRLAFRYCTNLVAYGLINAIAGILSRKSSTEYESKSAFCCLNLTKLCLRARAFCPSGQSIMTKKAQIYDTSVDILKKRNICVQNATQYVLESFFDIKSFGFFCKGHESGRNIILHRTDLIGRSYFWFVLIICLYTK